MNIFKISIILSLAFGISQAEIPKACKPQAAIIEREMDMDTKTLKGWVRLLNNRSKMGEAGIYLTKEEVNLLITCIKIELENRKRAGKMQ